MSIMPYANNKGADQPAHLRSLISALVVHCLDSIVPILAKSRISRLYVVSVAEQAGMSLTWSQISKDTFSMMWLNWDIEIPVKIEKIETFETVAVIILKFLTEWFYHAVVFKTCRQNGRLCST